ncbi:MAG: hypothetical protein BWY65_00065 [Firmicutes bacterium ADurb.Bin373]|nr:hypothetical protein [Bacillota bacterium]OQA11269.1 MAG: hypothetical protein BWY65_00065 [Firmicutes bacterium ADurb.Bin373]
MIKLSHLTPDGKITIPRSIMKFLNIKGGNDIIFEIQGGMLIMKKTEKIDQVTAENLIYKAV